MTHNKGHSAYFHNQDFLMPDFKSRRIARIRQEIDLLESMNDRLMIKKLIMAGPFALLFLTLIIGGAIIGLHLLPNGLGAIFVAFTLAGLLVWLFRYSLSVPVSIAILLINIPLAFAGEQLPDPTLDFQTRKGARNIKIAKAIEKRRALLAKLESQQ